MAKVHKLILTIAMCVIISGMFDDRATSGVPTEYQIKAAFLYNFVKFVEWPAKTFASPESPIVIGILGDDPFGRILEQTVGGKTVGDRRLVIKRSSKVSGMTSCHILFISSSEGSRIGTIIEALKGSSVLTVGDGEGFARRGVIINFVTVENKVGFEVNVEAARRAGLKISSKLLTLAKVVKD